MDEQLKKKFQALLEYQKKDIELRKLNLEIERDTALAAVNKYKRLFNEAKAAIAECDSEASTILEQYGTLVKYIEENEAVLESFEQSESESEEDLAARVKRLDSLKSKFVNAEKKMQEIESRAKSACKRRADALKSGKDAQSKHNAAREQHMQFVGSRSGALNKIKSELAELRKGLDGELYREYETLDADGKFPPVAPARIGEKNMYSCGGCGIGLSQNENAQLLSRGWCRCETCHRIIVKL